VHGLACLAVLREIAGELPITAAAGLSLGEWTAHAAAGTFSFEDGLRLVEQRGEFMEAACEATVGAMAAMIGADESAARALAAAVDIDVANLNSPGQVVVSGERAKVELAIGLAKEHGIRRATLLNVAGAYHSRLMESAYMQVGEALHDVVLQKPGFLSSAMLPERRWMVWMKSSTPCRIRLPARCVGPIAWSGCSRWAAIFSSNSDPAVYLRD
jgi:[acyl-carrier-protein] S-malonyltransferase